jgi:dihydroxyacetone kinase DhaKLM complex PTS-EIIA-like component DhaM
LIDGGDGVLVLLDLGSAWLSVEMALEELSEKERARVHVSEAPLVEGAVLAAVQASVGASLSEVAAAAAGAASMSKAPGGQQHA